MKEEYTSILRNIRETNKTASDAVAEATVVKVHYLMSFTSLESNTETELGFADDASFHGQLN